MSRSQGNTGGEDAERAPWALRGGEVRGYVRGFVGRAKGVVAAGCPCIKPFLWYDVKEYVG